MILRRIIAHFRKQEWTAIAIDFLIVVVGVFIGIQVANWNDARLEAQRERGYLVALQGDFREVITELEHDIARHDEIANAMTFLLEQSRRPRADASLDDLNEAARLLVTMEGLAIVSETYSNLTGSGDLAIIHSQELKDAMASFFAKYDIVVLVSATHEQQLVGIFQPYIIENLDYVGMLNADRGVAPSAAFGPGRIQTALRTNEFRNVVAIKWDIETDLRNVMTNALDQARRVDALLTEELAPR